MKSNKKNHNFRTPFANRDLSNPHKNKLFYDPTSNYSNQKTERALFSFISWRSRWQIWIVMLERQAISGPMNHIGVYMKKFDDDWIAGMRPRGSLRAGDLCRPVGLAASPGVSHHAILPILPCPAFLSLSLLIETEFERLLTFMGVIFYL